ncbi:MAG: DUF4325 domain-containing protein [Erysipelotrichia bacterium]|nr:DUF4325 domain-containing protein [Erysipelotrichia bacterium]
MYLMKGVDMVINIKNEIGGFDYAGSRDSGVNIRETLRENLEKGINVTLDFTGMSGISHSFADEIVGIVVRAYGVDFIKNKLMLNNDNAEIKSLLNLVIRESRKISA